MPLVTIAALLGAADTVAFLAARPALWTESPSRARGSAAFAALWLAVAAASARDRHRAGAPTLALAGLCCAGNAAMLAVHLRARITSPRVWGGAALSGVVLGGALASRR